VLNGVFNERHGDYYYQAYYSPNSTGLGKLPNQPVQPARFRRRWQWLPFFK
jgi:hypothetical protein